MLVCLHDCVCMYEYVHICTLRAYEYLWLLMCPVRILMHVTRQGVCLYIYMMVHACVCVCRHMDHTEFLNALMEEPDSLKAASVWAK